MTNIQITVRNKKATNATPGVPIVCGNSCYTVTFDFDDEWAVHTSKVARFVYYKNGRARHQEQSFSGNTVAVPILSGVTYVLIGVYVGDLSTTTPARVICSRSILCDDSEEYITPEMQQALQAQIGNLDELCTEEKTNLVQAINWLLEHGGESEIFWVTVRGDDTNGYRCENTLDEIYEAYADGKLLFCALYMDGIRVNLSVMGVTQFNAVFNTFVENAAFTVIIDSTGAQLSTTPFVAHDDMGNLVENIDEYIDNRIDEKLAESGSGGNVDVTIDGETLVIAEHSTATIENETLIL